MFNIENAKPHQWETTYWFNEKTFTAGYWLMEY